MTSPETDLGHDSGNGSEDGVRRSGGETPQEAASRASSGGYGTTSRARWNEPSSSRRSSPPLLIWTLVYVSGLASEIVLPSPWATAEAGYEMATSGTLASDTWASVQRIYHRLRPLAAHRGAAGPGDGHASEASAPSSSRRSA